MPGRIKNIIIAGTGGQGVNSLYRIIIGLCAKKRLYTKSALFKGGAQRHGTVHATIKIFLDEKPDDKWYTSQIRKGSLDLLIGLELWETLRFCRFARRETTIWSNTMIVPLIGDRSYESRQNNPIEILKKLPNNLTLENYSEKALNKFNDHRMANIIMGIEIIERGLLPFTIDEFIKEFFEIVKPAKETEKLIKKEFPWIGKPEKDSTSLEI